MDEVLKATQYSGIKEANTRIISASQLGADPQEVLMRYKYGIIDDDTIGQNTLGSLVHIALEKIYSNKKGILVEYCPKPIKIDDLFLTGSIDRIDIINKEIIDIKVTKTYAIKKMIEGTSEAYRWQLSAYRYLMYRETGDDFKCFIEAWDKQGGYDVRKGEDIPTKQKIEIEPYSYEQVKARFRKLVEFVKKGVEKQCDDVFLRKIKGKTVPLKCLKYCSYNKVCKFYNPKVETVMTGWDV